MTCAGCHRSLVGATIVIWQGKTPLCSRATCGAWDVKAAVDETKRGKR